MLPVLQSYGAYVAREILATGAQIEIWDLGNEVNFGFAGVAPAPQPLSCPEEGRNWYRAPDAIDPAIGQMSVSGLVQMSAPNRITWLQNHVWPHEAKMLLALAKGIRSVDPGAKFATHITLPDFTDDTLAFYRAMDAGGMHFDQLGLSVYVTSGPGPDARWQGTQRTIMALRQEFGRPIFLAEVAYPSGQIRTGPFFNWDQAVTGYPLSEQGQADFFCQMVSWGSANGVIGIRPWVPDYVDSSWAPLALFRRSGAVFVAKPAMDALTPNCADSLRSP
jgi:arabinogalactan endo-1,4-beta-galactosidase